MSKTPFSSKCDVLGALWLYYRDTAKTDEAWSEFFEYNDIGLPLAYLIAEGLAQSTGEDSEQMIDETWLMFCGYIDIDPDGEYKNIVEAFEASNQPPLDIPEDE